MIPQRAIPRAIGASRGLHRIPHSGPTLCARTLTTTANKARQPRELPEGQSLTRRLLIYGSLATGVLLSWGGFISYATNAERLSSSVVRQILTVLQDPTNSEIVDVLGDRVALQPSVWAFGHPWIDGSINLLQGKVNLSFRVAGSNGAGTVYFSSLRSVKGSAFDILRFKIIADDGRVILLNKPIEPTETE